MVYISSDGTLGGKKTIWSHVTGFFQAIYETISLFFLTISNPKQIQEQARRNNRSTYAQRNNRYTNDNTTTRNNGGPNIRGIKNLSSTANCAVGGG